MKKKMNMHRFFFVVVVVREFVSVFSLCKGSQRFIFSWLSYLTKYLPADRMLEQAAIYNHKDYLHMQMH